MDDRPEAGAAPPEGSPRRPPGPERTYLDQRRRAELLDEVEKGRGVDKALREMKVPYRAYRNTIEDDAEFRAEVASARRAASQTLDEFGFLKAQDPEGGSDVLLRIWDRRDKARDLNRAQADRRRERAEDHKRADRDRRDRLRKEQADRKERDKDRALRLHLAELAAAARAKEQAERAGDRPETDDAPELDRLTPEQVAAYRDSLRSLLGADDDGPG